MNRTADTISRAYQHLLKLYPAGFRAQYGEEMGLVFHQGCSQSAEISNWSLVIFSLRELRDLPINLLKEHCAEFWRVTMQSNIQPTEPLPRSIARGAIGFGIGFAAIFLLFCVVDTLLNAGMFIWRGSSIWNGFQFLHPTALAYGIGAGILGLIINKRRAWVSAVMVFLAYTLVWRVWAILYLEQRSPKPSNLESLLVPYVFSTIVGLVIGGLIGWSQRGRKSAGWYALVGVIGFNLGWVIKNAFSLFLINISPFAHGLDRLVVGDPWYYLYFILPAVIYGAIVGAFMAIPAALWSARTPVAV